MSSSIRLERLRLRSFRGATREVPIEFDPSKKITMVFGENGTGKSTMVDALTFLCEQSIGSLGDRAGAKDEKYLVSAGSTGTDLLVEIKAGGRTWTATLSGTTIQVSPAGGCPAIKVLRRPQLSRFIEAEPRTRFQELRQFISTPGIEQSEAVLRDAERAEVAQLDLATRDLEQARAQLTRLWEKEGKEGADAESWAGRIARQDVAKSEASNVAIEGLERLVNTLSSGIAALSATLNQEDKTRAELETALSAQRIEEKKAADQSSDLLQLLQAAVNYVDKHKDLSSCPVCKKQAERDALHAELSTRVKALNRLSQAIAITGRSKKALENAETRTKDSFKTTTDTLVEVQEHLARCQFPTTLVQPLGAQDPAIFLDNSRPGQERVGAAKRVLAALQRTASARKTHSAGNAKAVNLKNAVSLHLGTVHEHERDARKGDALTKRLRRAVEIVEDERKKFVADILASISGDVVTLYRRLHPNEPVGDITLALDPRFQFSLLLKGDFIGEKDVPPQAYFSDSHLDTLGICIFLAFAKRFSPPGTLVVLDDVLTSVDSSHLDRFIDLLDSEASSFGHVVITTHYRPWRERYRMHQAAASKIHFIELKEWSPEGGLLPDTCIPAIGELRGWLEPRRFDRQIVAAKGGILLEAILDHLSLLYRVRMPRKPVQDYTLGEFLDSFSRKDRNLLRVEKLDAASTVTTATALGPIIDALDAMAWVRNQVGCHFSLSGQSIPDSDVRAFGKRVVELGEALACPEGGDFPGRNRSGSYFESRHGRCRLNPLQLP